MFPRLTRDRAPHDPVRIWSLGCSTGEEAYLIAMAFVEFTSLTRPPVPLQIFATHEGSWLDPLCSATQGQPQHPWGQGAQPHMEQQPE